MKANSGLFGVVYLIFAICMTNYGTRLSLILSNLVENSSEKEEKELFKAMNFRIFVLTVIMSLIFGVRAVFNLLFTWGLLPRYYPDTLNPIFWQSFVSKLSLLYNLLTISLNQLIQCSVVPNNI